MVRRLFVYTQATLKTMPGMSRKIVEGPIQPYEAFGQVVRRLRAEEQLSQEELGARSGLDRTYISGVERGKRNPTIQSIWKIAEGLTVKPSELFEQVQLEMQKH